MLLTIHLFPLGLDPAGAVGIIRCRSLIRIMYTMCHGISPDRSQRVGRACRPGSERRDLDSGGVNPPGWARRGRGGRVLVVQAVTCRIQARHPGPRGQDLGEVNNVNVCASLSPAHNLHSQSVYCKEVKYSPAM